MPFSKAHHHRRKGKKRRTPQQQQQQSPPPHEKEEEPVCRVKVDKTRLTPEELQIERGQRVEWYASTDEERPGIRCPGIFGSSLDETFSFQFQERGTYEIIHTGSGMLQSIKVVATEGQCYTASDSFADSDDDFSDGELPYTFDMLLAHPYGVEDSETTRESRSPSKTVRFRDGPPDVIIEDPKPPSRRDARRDARDARRLRTQLRRAAGAAAAAVAADAKAALLLLVEEEANDDDDDDGVPESKDVPPPPPSPPRRKFVAQAEAKERGFSRQSKKRLRKQKTSGGENSPAVTTTEPTPPPISSPKAVEDPVPDEDDARRPTFDAERAEENLRRRWQTIAGRLDGDGLGTCLLISY